MHIAYSPSQVISHAEILSLRKTAARLDSLHAKQSELFPINWEKENSVARAALRANPTLEAVQPLFERIVHESAGRAFEAVRNDITFGAQNVFMKFAFPILSLVISRAEQINRERLAQRLKDDAAEVADHVEHLVSAIPCSKIVAGMRAHAGEIAQSRACLDFVNTRFSPQWPPPIADILRKLSIDLASDDQVTEWSTPVDLGAPVSQPALSIAVAAPGEGRQLSKPERIARLKSAIEDWRKAPEMGTSTESHASAQIDKARADLDAELAKPSLEAQLAEFDDETIAATALHFGIAQGSLSRAQIVEQLLTLE